MSLRVILFTKPGCSLCVPVWQLIQRVTTAWNTGSAAENKLRAQIYQVDISVKQNKKWWDEYKWDIPVVHVDRDDNFAASDVACDAYATRHKVSDSADYEIEPLVLQGLSLHHEVARHRMNEQQLSDAMLRFQNLRIKI
eukprot:g54566.t1